MIKFSVSRLDKEPIELCGSEDKDFISLPEGDAYTVISPLEYQLNVMKVSGGIPLLKDIPLLGLLFSYFV